MGVITTYSSPGQRALLGFSVRSIRSQWRTKEYSEVTVACMSMWFSFECGSELELSLPFSKQTQIVIHKNDKRRS